MKIIEIAEKVAKIIPSKINIMENTQTLIDLIKEQGVSAIIVLILIRFLILYSYECLQIKQILG